MAFGRLAVAACSSMAMAFAATTGTAHAAMPQDGKYVAAGFQGKGSRISLIVDRGRVQDVRMRVRANCAHNALRLYRFNTAGRGRIHRPTGSFMVYDDRGGLGGGMVARIWVQGWAETSTVLAGTISIFVPLRRTNKMCMLNLGTIGTNDQKPAFRAELT